MCNRSNTILVLILWLFLISSFVMAGEEKGAKPQFKLVIGEDRSVKVYDMQGNLIADKPGTEQQDTKGLAAEEVQGEQKQTSYFKHKTSELEKEIQAADSVNVNGTDEQSVINADELAKQSLDSFITTEIDGVMPSVESPDEPGIQLQQQEENVPPAPNIDTMQNNQIMQLQEEGAPLPDRVEDTSAAPNLMIYTGSGSDNTTSYDPSTHVLAYNVSVGNSGDASAGAFRVGLYISLGNTTITTSDKLLMYASVTSLASMYFSQITGTIDLDNVSGLSTGTYYPGVYIDYLYQVSESNEGDNTGYWDISISWPPSGSPNLTLYQGAGATNSATYNSSTHILTMNCSVENNGTGSAGAFRIGWYLSTNTTISTGDNFVTSYYKSSLSAGSNFNSTSTKNLHDFSCSALPSGTYYVGPYIDYQNSVSESDESDNDWYFTPAISYTCPTTSLSNLDRYDGTGAVRSYSYNGSTHVLTLNYSVINNGTASAGAFRVGWYLSDNTSISTSDHFLVSYNISSLGVGAWQNTTNTKNLDDFTCTQLPGDTYYVGVMIDDQDAVSESDETDNNWFFTTPFDYTCEITKPNLKDYTGTGSNNSVTYNSIQHRLTLSFSVQNDGDTGSGAFRVGWYLSDNTTISTSDYFVDSDAVSSLAVGSYVIVSASKDLDGYCGGSGEIAAGDYYVGVIIDDHFDIAEKDENDNNFYFSQTVTYVGCGPNLSLYTGSGSNNILSYNGTSHIITYNTSVINDGSGAAGAFRIGWYLSDNTTISTSDHLIVTASVSSLAEGTYVNKSGSKDLDDFCGTGSEIPAGTYYGGLLIDDQNDVTEGTEGDNNYYWSSPTITYSCPSSSAYKISGTMNYYMGAAAAIDNAQTDLTGNATRTANTNASGYYEFANLASGNYTVSASKARSGSKEASISAFDASYILRYYVSDPTITFSEAQKIAADASGNGSISAYDASIVLRYYVGDDVTEFDVANWTFVVPPVTNWLSPVTTRSYAPLSGDQANQNFEGILIGDVTGNYTGSMLAKAGDGQVVPGEMKSLSGNLLELPVRIEGVSSYSAVGFELKIDTEQLKVEKVSLARESENVLLAFHEQNGTLRVAVAGANAFKDTDLLICTFKQVSNANMNDIKIQLTGYEIDAKRVDSPQEWLVAVEKLPQQFDMKQNYPNPFNPSTKIVYSVPQKSAVKIVIYNTVGQRLRELLNTYQDAGNYEIHWDGRDENGMEAPSGIYIVRFVAENFSKTIKVVKTK